MPQGCEVNTLLLKLGIGGAIVLVAAVWHQVDRNAAYADGQRAERVAWQQVQAAAEAQADKDRKAAQDKINAAEQDYLEQIAAAEIQKSALKKELADATDTVRKCTAVTRQLRDRLETIGRPDP